MTATAVQKEEKSKEKIFTVEEYFELEKHSDIRHEFINGKLIAMPGESVTANRIADNCGFQLRISLNKKGYDTIRHDVRTVSENRKKYRYPDVALAKRAEITDSHAIRKPELLIEVTSENSVSTDRKEKLKEYTALPSLQYYLIVSQEEMFVEVYSRGEKGWLYKVYESQNEEILLPHLACSLLLADIYENVLFADAKSDDAHNAL
jgi:Uma2 family endonuclease